MRICGHPGRRTAFSLIELVGVLVILGALSVTVLPALQRIESSRRTALAAEIERRLTLARASAMATGDAHGLRIDLDQGLIEGLRIEDSGAIPTRAIGATGDEVALLDIASSFPGAAIASFSNGDGQTSNTTVWFAYDGTPHLRDADGVFLENFEEDARIRVADGRVVRVRRTTGLIEQES